MKPDLSHHLYLVGAALVVFALLWLTALAMLKQVDQHVCQTASPTEAINLHCQEVK